MKRFWLLVLVFVYTLVLAEYVVVVRTEPFSWVYVDGIYRGITDINGVLVLTFQTPGQYRISVTKSFYLPFEGVVLVTQAGQAVVQASLKRAGQLRVFSNVYPVEVYAEDYYLGTIRSVKDTVLVPEGSQYLTFKASGYQPQTHMVNVAYAKETAVNLTLVEETLTVNLKIEPKTFSPNNDWYQDATSFYIYLSKPADLIVNVVDKSDRTVWTKSLKGKAGTNVLAWYGTGVEDGEYVVEVVARTPEESYTARETVFVDRSVYTYTKEKILTVSAIGLGAVLLLLLISSSR
ncbi:MAG: Uncharacterized protein XD58_1090 [Thermotoga sp. 50_1627]|uniref:hypothetical protein n=1 Tax=Pseudothermotoga sp. TaxID=2033661 RepID=UPI00076D3BE7|nr:MAG: Uncharacterized protein XD45_0732 [Thermotoga sp. 50_64]KUK24878.1 MAG: Uncharacterized protein XD58_1090 [Thermotoga sp. 50_1627]MBC7116206.1 hypothetical protein [Pseudothermotoga sp.]MDK2923356.1 hypothetical protein [Pseudothermotoga sp.]HBT38770.1 hypothetical protein [Pseudothermotoga sp.]